MQEDHERRLNGIEGEYEKRMQEAEEAWAQEREKVVLDGKKIEAELLLKLKNKQRQLDNLQEEMTMSVDNFKTQIIELNNQKDEQDLLIGEKCDIIEELEKEIDEFTTSVEQNMIKICDHEDILNQ